MSGTPSELTPRLKIEPLDLWGNLVKSWATEENYIDTPFARQPPRTNPRGSHGASPPPTDTLPDVDPKSAPPPTAVSLMPWALPPMRAVPVPCDGGPVYLPRAVVLTAKEFKDRLITVTSVEGQFKPVDVPTQYQHIIIVQGDEHTMVLRLPPRDILQGSEDDLVARKLDYQIPDFYTEIYKPEPPTDPKSGPQSDKVKLIPPIDRDKIMELHAYRIGEYTLNSCS